MTPATATVSTDDASHLERTMLYIGGDWVHSTGSDTLVVEDPSRAAVLGHVPAATAADVDGAVRAAHAAFDSWSALPVTARADLLRRLMSAIASRREPLAELVTREMGTPLTLSKIVQADLPVAVLGGFIDAMPQLDDAEEIGNSLVVRESAGVVAAITPWNYPIHQAVGKVGAALAAGCTVVLKPSEVTPLSAYLLVEAAVEAGLPPGVLNLVTGAGAVGEALVSHPLVDVVSFTGSTATGRRIMSAASGTIKRVSLELGGKSANVLLPDADFETAVRRGTEHVLENSGQTCTAWTRMLVPAARQAEVVDMVRSAMAEVVMGDPLDEGTTLGPVASGTQRETVERLIAAGLSQGARLAVGTADRPDREGHYVTPVAFADVASDMTIAQEEIFGPVLSIVPYQDEGEALRMANDSVYGLSGAVWSADQDRAMAFARGMRTGQVSVNGGSWNPRAPFGGFKQSGVGRELGRFGLDDFLEIKAIQR